ncbi:hypothetical protein F5Y06DRAFT_259206 [Hypoxylon sp. FL0890]|nr:hypothetical protein F5Y06DRAFT_259206 [Hypoxylon sp. FL0890]
MAATTAHTQRLLMRPVPPFRFQNPSSASSLRTYSTQPPRGPNNTVKFWPFIAIIGIGSAGYVFMVRSRAETRNAPVKKMQ